MLKTIDKKAIWNEITASVEAAVGPMLFNTLVHHCWLDSFENDLAIIAVDAYNLAASVQRRASKTLRFAFEEMSGKPVKIRIVKGHSRIHVQASKQDVATQGKANRGEQDELFILHAKYGDIIGIVDNHPTFKKATAPMDKNGWGIFPQLLTLACKEYGVLAVLQGLRFVANRPSVRNPRAFFFNALKKGQFGHKLVITPAVVGPVFEEKGHYAYAAR